MLISYNWLKEHVALPPHLTAQELGDKFKLAVVEVEKIVRQGESLGGIVVGEILSFRKHTNADKLSVAQVDIGEAKPRQIVFGQMVVMKVGYKVPVALAPTILPGNHEIKKGEIRGELSEGMLCLDQELGFLNKGVSIRFFGKDVKNGTPLIAALNLNDTILEIDNKSLSHRPDLWGHRGLAREAAALFNRELKNLKLEKIKPGKEIDLNVKVENTKLCPRYLAVAVSGVKVAPSPAWLQNRLLSVGLNPINNIVDITNYVMLDLGQPLHAFDASVIASPVRPMADGTKQSPSVIPTKVGISVRLAKPGEKIKALDGKEYNLTENDLVIADSAKPVAIAGVMGGEDSGVSDTTTEIIFESANFDAVSVRKTSTRLGLRSDSAQRFEKSLDPNLCEAALQKAVAMTLEICPEATVASAVVDKKNFSLFTGPIIISKNIFTEKLGVEIPQKQVVNILAKLGFEVKEKKDELSVLIPTWRATKDIAIAEDIVEEVARVYGFSNITPVLPSFSITPAGLFPVQKLQRAIRQCLTRELGYSEMYNYSFVSKNQIVKLGDDESRYLELDNPISKEKPFIRRNLLPNLLDNIGSNASRFDEIKLFEIGKVFHADEAGARVSAGSDKLLPRQDVYLTAVYYQKNNSVPFWDIKLLAETLGRELKLDFEYAPASERPLHVWQHPERATWIKLGDVIVGRAYELHPTTLKNYNIPGRAAMYSLNLSELAEILPKHQKSIAYKAVSLYPEIKRDLAFVVDTKIVHTDVVAALGKIDPLITEAELFDVYAGDKLPVGKKSMAYRLTLSCPDRTLESKEADAVVEKAVAMLAKKFGAEMRK